MAVLTKELTGSEHRQQRRALQERLKRMDEVKEAHRKTAEELRMAEDAVKRFEKPAGYVEMFRGRHEPNSRELVFLMQECQQQLINSCHDRSLRDEFEMARERRTRALKDRGEAERELNTATECVSRIISRLSNAGAVKEAIPADSQPNWRRLSEQMHPTDVAHYREQWSDYDRLRRRASELVADCQDRIDQAQSQMDAAKEKMIWSVK